MGQAAARELDLYAENTAELYPQFQSIIANIKRKIAAGRYKPGMAPKLWGYWYAAAAKRYVREFGGDVRTQFPTDVRAHLARERAKDEYKKILAGEHGAVVRTRAAKRKRAYGARRRNY